MLNPNQCLLFPNSSFLICAAQLEAKKPPISKPASTRRRLAAAPPVSPNTAVPLLFCALLLLLSLLHLICTGRRACSRACIAACICTGRRPCSRACIAACICTAPPHPSGRRSARRLLQSLHSVAAPPAPCRQQICSQPRIQLSYKLGGRLNA
ncbi:uncharacterized protein LOC130997174 [Salvia miltiorrhiza]|uniref:uncharacterized protein LOC130997174 n=1 Tax=Salvia miltiorrhiza TaxID=226208 RepID=UPI0025AD232D|nr:uncharacterized protein LOC130997174 [Salvia miltiorrhiza]